MSSRRRRLETGFDMREGRAGGGGDQKCVHESCRVVYAEGNGCRAAGAPNASSTHTWTHALPGNSRRGSTAAPSLRGRWVGIPQGSEGEPPLFAMLSHTRDRGWPAFEWLAKGDRRCGFRTDQGRGVVKQVHCSRIVHTIPEYILFQQPGNFLWQSDDKCTRGGTSLSFKFFAMQSSFQVHNRAVPTYTRSPRLIKSATIPTREIKVLFETFRHSVVAGRGGLPSGSAVVAEFDLESWVSCTARSASASASPGNPSK